MRRILIVGLLTIASAGRRGAASAQPASDAVIAADQSIAVTDALVTLPAAITARDIHGGGGWGADNKEVLGSQRWTLDVHRGDDNTIRGRVIVADSPLLVGGNVEGKIDGTNMSGTVIDDDGNQILTFDGTIDKTGMRGKYTDRTGEVGSWAWDGPALQ